MGVPTARLESPFPAVSRIRQAFLLTRATFTGNGREAQAEPRGPELIIPAARGSASSMYAPKLAEPCAVESHLYTFSHTAV